MKYLLLVFQQVSSLFLALLANLHPVFIFLLLFSVSSVNLALMISLVVVCVIVVVLAILLVVFGMRIKALRHQKVAGMDSSDP